MLPIDNTAVEILLLLWMLAFGGAIGSFLNVVVYRTPRGRSIVHPGSQCPSCGHAIRTIDNVPVLAWLWLRGRCRDCQVKISARYPIVEFITAVLFASLGWVEVFQNGGTVAAVDPITYLPWPFAWKCGLWAFHMLLLCTLLSAGLIRFDGLRVPRAIWYLAAAVALVAPVVWPWLLPGESSTDSLSSGLFVQVLQLAVVLGFVAIILAVVWMIDSLKQRQRNTISQTIDSPLAMLIVISLFLGIPAGTSITLVSLGLSTIGTRLAGRLLPTELISVGVSWGWIVCWPWLCDTFPVLGPGGDLKFAVLLFGGMAIAIGVLAAWTEDSQKSQPI